MKISRLFSLELKRLLCSRVTWLVMLLSIASPIIGLTLYKHATAETMLSMYLANPAVAGGAAGGILFGLLTIYELSRFGRSRINILINAVISPLHNAVIQLLALICTAMLTLAFTMVIWFPVINAQVGSVMDITNYTLAFVIFTGLVLPAAVLAAASVYNFTQRADLSVVVFAAFCGLSLTVWSDNWQLCWLNPCVWALSDDFSNFRIFRSVAYMRLTWLVGLTGVWAVSWLCIRQYGKNIFASVYRNGRRIYRPIAAVVLISCSCAAYGAQPFIDRSNPDLSVMTFEEIPYIENVVCSGRGANVYPDTDDGTLYGTASYSLINSSGQPQTAAFGINPGYKILSVRANGEDVNFSVGDYQEYNEALLKADITAAESTELIIEYSGFPQESRGLSTHQGSLEISDTYICLQNAVLAPRLINVLPDEGMYPATIEINLLRGMTVIPFCVGNAEITAEHDNGNVTWRYEDNGTGGIIYAGDYLCKEINAGDVNIEFYYGSKHENIMEEAEAAEAIRTVVDYCTEHYGALSFGMGRTLKLIQSRVTGGGYATDGASLLDEVDFTAANLRDESKGAIAGEVMLHELAHQWWGLANMFDNSDETSSWSAEGLTVYTTYRIVKELYGEDYARENYVEKWQIEAEDYYLNFYVRNPEYLEMLPEDKRLRVLGNLTHVRQYCEMPLKILKAEKLVGGEEVMDEILSGLFNRQLDPENPYLTYQDFLNACGLREEDLNLV